VPLRNFFTSVDTASGRKIPSRFTCALDNNSLTYSSGRGPKNDLPSGAPVRLFRPSSDRRREQLAGDVFQQIFLVERLHLERWRQPRRERDDTWIEERMTAFDAVRHRDAVALRRQEISGQQVGGLQILRLREGMPAAILGRTAPLRYQPTRRSPPLPRASPPRTTASGAT
jgi:hypothetical protein